MLQQTLQAANDASQRPTNETAGRELAAKQRGGYATNKAASVAPAEAVVKPRQKSLGEPKNHVT